MEEMHPDDAPGDWFRIDTQYDFQKAAYRNPASGNVLVVEEKEEPWHADIEDPDVNVLVLPPDFEEQPDPLREVASKKEPSEAMRAAIGFMESGE
jgi:hypothetical protein